MDNQTLRAKLISVKEGDREAFEVIYKEFQRPIYTVILRMVRNSAVAEDIFQDFFVKLFQSPPVSATSNPRAYLFQMAHNLVIDFQRKQPQIAQMEELDTLAVTQVEQYAQRLDIQQALDTLADTERQIVLLHIYGGLKFREVAEIVALPLGTVLWKYQKALGKLKTMLEGGTL